MRNQDRARDLVKEKMRIVEKTLNMMDLQTLQYVIMVSTLTIENNELELKMNDRLKMVFTRVWKMQNISQADIDNAINELKSKVFDID